MEARCVSRYIRQSPRKMRIVLDEVRGKKVGYALNYLHFSPHKASYFIEKTLRSAVVNLLQKSESTNVDPDTFIVSRAYVDEGPYTKRFRAASMGRISRINRPSSHLTIYVSDET